MSLSHEIVTVVGALFATAVVFVTDGRASEAAIEALAHMLEERMTKRKEMIYTYL